MLTSTRSQIVECEKVLLIAMQYGNLEKLDQLIHNDLAFVIPSGQVITKAMDLQAYRSKKMIISSIIASEQEIIIFEDTATVTVTIDMKGTYLNQALDGKYRYLRTWKLFGSSWKVIAGSSTPL